MRISRVVMVLALAIFMVLPSAALATAPDNDNFSSPTLIESLPYNTTLNTRDATRSPEDPVSSAIPTILGATVWYSFTPNEDMIIDANTIGSTYDTVLMVLMGMPGAFAEVTSDDNSANGQARVIFNVQAGWTYYFLIGAYNLGQGGDLTFSVTKTVPPTLQVSIDPAGSVLPSTGVATIKGTVTASGPMLVAVDVNLKQRAGRLIIDGFGSSTLYVREGVNPWSVTVTSFNGIFVGGKVTARVNAWSPYFQCTDQKEATVTLKGAKH